METIDQNESIQQDAQEFGLCVKQGGWRMGLLVARNVELGTAGRPKIGEDSPIKVSLSSFAEQAGIDKNTVKKYLDAWNRAADKGLVQPSSLLSPGEEPEYLDTDKLPSWNAIYTPRKKKTTKTEIETETTETETPSDDNASCVNSQVPPRQGFVRDANDRLREGLSLMQHLSEDTHSLIAEDIQETERLIAEIKANLKVGL